MDSEKGVGLPDRYPAGGLLASSRNTGASSTLVPALPCGLASQAACPAWSADGRQPWGRRQGCLAAYQWPGSNGVTLAGETILDALPAMVATCGRNGAILSANAAFADFHGSRRDALTGLCLAEVVGANLFERLSFSFREALSGRASRDILRAVLKDGREALLDIALEPLTTTKGKIAGVIYYAVDAGERREADTRLPLRRADELTGVLGRQAFLELLAQTVAAKGDTCALLVVNLDNFRLVNDLAGHAAGDSLLRHVAGLLKSFERDGLAVAGRLGGDEFAVLMAGAAADGALAAGRRIVEGLQASRFVWDEESYGVSCRVGIFLLDESEPVAGPSPADDFLRRADQACRVAKQAGGGRVVVYRSDNAAMEACHEDLGNLHAIQDALEGDRLRLFVMPIEAIDGSGRLHHEVLLRVASCDGDMLAPAPLIQAAERYGLMPKVDRWVICNVLRRLQTAHDAAEPARRLTVNLSGQSIGDADFKDYLIARLDAVPHLARHLSFEITETAAVRCMDTAQALLKALRERGCGVILDDFGTGLSSFAYLKQFKIDCMKIDGAIIGDIVRDEVQRTIVAGIVAVARKLGIEVIAEFVEDGETLAMLRHLGVTHAQGYFIGRPVEWAEAARAGAAECDVLVG
ncbi:EAL domain-containing protein [Stappia sp. F7233]|uniref:EAL domain-containing protein n=1 Tax=Stappia albiluteola TaxID=2758565 RepID=A0A839AJP4_9HYPH|nr:GGDEF and EAL domain-containing protein [Stappia albiluteola]MBA5779194.1 EAL domain-containing protein [Stappia albiluteola]